MFADDATFALDGTFNSFCELIDGLEAFKSVSGLKLNNKKKHCPTKRVFKKLFETLKLYMVIRISKNFRNSIFCRK